MEEEDLVGGSYEPFEVILEREGGRYLPTSQEAARQYVTTCVQKGGRWVRRNPMTARLECLYLKVGMRRTFRQKQTLELEQTDCATVPAAQSNGSKRSIADDDNDPPHTAKRAKAKAKASPKVKSALQINMARVTGGTQGRFVDRF